MNKQLLRLGLVLLAMTSSASAADPSKSEHAAHHQMMQGMTDADFVPMMIKHHQDGIAMARLEEERGASAATKALAAKIRQAQDKDVAELRALERSVGATKSSEHGAHEKMMEQQSQATMTRLKSLSGNELDHAFLEEMATHHQMAITMGETAKLQNAELKQLVNKMVAGQRKELAELKKDRAAHDRS